MNYAPARETKTFYIPGSDFGSFWCYWPEPSKTPRRPHTHPIRSIAQLRGLWLPVRSCRGPEVKCKRSVRLFFVSFRAERVCAGAGYYHLCETRLCGNGIDIFPWRGNGILGIVQGVCASTGFHIYHGSTGLPRTTRGKNSEECNSICKK